MCSVVLVTSTFTYQKSLQKYTHLTLEQRYQISSDLKSNISISEIARRLGCHKSIISREIKRNTGLRGYRPKQDQSKAST